MTTGRGRPDEARERRVKELFERVLDAPPEERDALLAGGDPSESVRADVAALLRHEAELGDFLETPAGHRILGTPAAESRLAPGDRIADFTVVGLLGEGGGGVVHEAEQREPRRRVALKMIRVRSRAREALRGFRDEAANLARLHHAAVAHVYAAGVREHDGRAEPWIAMELIQGARSLVAHARDASLGRDERLRLFLVVCDALHHAHENGVIHRDVTPGNVLVDAEGRPKVVDFGVACGIAEGDERASDAVGTLAYASPEQLSGARGGADRRADVYGLGAVLYELLTGTVPVDVDDLPAAEVARVKREARVPPPSARAAGIPPDLDAVVLRALEPDRDARYPTAAALAADLTRFLAGEPVTAYAGGGWYQFGKLVRRRRVAAAAIAGVAAALVAGAAVSLWLALENAAARDLADRRSYVAEIAAAASALRVDDIAEARRRLERAPAALRDWEWRLLASRIDVSAETSTFPQREIWYGSASADGALVAISGLDRGTPSGFDQFVALARRDGTVVAQWFQQPGDEPGTIRVLRGDGTSVGEWPTSEQSSVPAVALSRDGSRLVVGLNTGGVFTYDVARGAESPVTSAHPGRVIAVAFSPSGEFYATAGKDGTAGLWSARDGAPVRTFADHADRVICLAFDASGARLATGCRDGTIHVFDTATGRLLRLLSGHEASVEGVSFSPDGTRVASGSRDRTVRLWDLAGGSAVAVGRSHTSNVRDVAFDPDGTAFVSASWDGMLRVWDARTGTERAALRGHASAVTSVGFTGGAAPLVSFSRDGTVKRWDPNPAGEATCRGLRDCPEALAFSPDGARVALAGRDGVLSVLDARTARVLETARPGESPLRDVRFLGPRTLALLTATGLVETWTLPDGAGAPVRASALADSATRVFAVSADRGGTALWTARDNGGVIPGSLDCFDVRGGAVRESRLLPISPYVIACDGRGTVALGGREGAVAVSLPGGEMRRTRVGASAIRCVAFDDAGERILAAAGSGDVYVLRTSDLATLLVLRGHSDDVYQAAFLPGGRRIVTVSRDVTVRLWDAADGENVLVLHEHGYPVTCVAVSPDGTRIATGAGAAEDVQSTVRIWTAPPGAATSPR